MKTSTREQGYIALVKQAYAKVNKCEDFYKRLSRKIRVAGKSDSTLNCYTRHLAQMLLYFECLPTDLDMEQIEEYLDLMLEQHDTPSESYFKFVVYSLGFAFKVEGLDYKRISLPAIKHEKKRSVILSRDEMCKLLRVPILLKHHSIGRTNKMF